MKLLRIISVFMLVLTLSPALGQKVKTFKVWVNRLNDARITGTLYTVDGDGLVILGEDLKQVTIDPKSIESIKVRRVGNVGRGAWIGAVSGLVLGGVAGYSSEAGSGWEDVGAIGGGLLGAPAGALIGLGVGSAKTRFLINGNRNTFNSAVPRLRQYTPH